MITIKVQLVNNVQKEIYLNIRQIVSFSASNGHTKVFVDGGSKEYTYLVNMKPEQLDDLIYQAQYDFEREIDNTN